MALSASEYVKKNLSEATRVEGCGSN